MDTEDEIEKLKDRVDKLERALSEVYPGWEYGAHKPDCPCAACQSY